MDVLLRREGYETIAAFSKEIFKDLDVINPDLILMDNRLGDGFGKDYCRQLKDDPATGHFKIILVSGAADLETLAGESKADGFLSKPFDLRKLTALVNRLTT